MYEMPQIREGLTGKKVMDQGRRWEENDLWAEPWNLSLCACGDGVREKEEYSMLYLNNLVRKW